MSHIFGCLITTAYLCPQKETPPDTCGKTRTVFKMITNPKTPFCMTNDYPNPIPDPTTVPQTSTLTYEQRLVIEDQLVEVFSEVIDLDDNNNGTASPVWRGSMSQLMEISWTLSRMHRIIDHDTRRPMTMYRIATLLCRNLHRRLPANIYSVARQSRLSRRPSVIDRIGRLYYEDGLTLRELLTESGGLTSDRPAKHPQHHNAQ